MFRVLWMAVALVAWPGPAAAADDSGTIDCRPGSGLGSTPPDVFVCRDPRGPGPLDDCFHAGFLLPVLPQVEYHGCRPPA